MNDNMKVNGVSVTWKHLATLAALVTALAGSIGGYYVLGYRLDATERTANEALHAAAEIPVIKRDIEYIRREIDRSIDVQKRTLDLLEKVNERTKSGS